MAIGNDDLVSGKPTRCFNSILDSFVWCAGAPGFSTRPWSARFESRSGIFKLLIWGWKQNNWTSVIHYSLRVSFNYSLLVLVEH